MNDKFLSLGAVVVFSIVLPGIVLLGLFMLLDRNLMAQSATSLSAIAITTGFGSNVIGHFAGIVFRSIFRRFQGIPFRSIYLRSYDISKEKAEMLRKGAEFWFSIHCMYWNTAFGLPIILLVAKSSTNVWMLGMAFWAVLIGLSVAILQGILDLTSRCYDYKPSFSHSFSISETEPVRIMGQNDIESVFGILTAERNAGNIWHSESKNEFKNIVSEWLCNPKLVVFVSEGPDGRVTGVLKLRRFNHRKRRHVAWIGPLAVSPEHHRNGYGRALVTHALSVCEKSGIKRVEMIVPVDAGPIIGLAKSTGFVEEGTLRRALQRDNGDYIDLFQFAKCTI